MTDASEAAALPASTPSGGIGSRPSKSVTRAMLTLPKRGDEIAMRWWGAGVGTYIAMAAVLYGSLATSDRDLGSALGSMVGIHDDRVNWSVLALVVAGVVLTVYAAYHLLREIREIRTEENDIAWVERYGRDGLLYVFDDPSTREARFRAKAHLRPNHVHQVQVETLIDDRVRRTQIEDDNRSATSAEELRIIAERRTSRWGGLARYISSLLLLLAVLGTFAGVKTALPELIDAVSKAGADVMGALGAPLEAVAGAFGGNALALIGAIAVGVMAQGVVFGRRHLLERLELVSSEYIYGAETSTTSDPVRAAMEMFTVSARDFREAAGAMMGIESGLEALGSQFEASFTSLGQQLTELADRSGDEMFDKTAAQLSTLQTRIAELVTAVNANAGVYAGLVPTLEYRKADAAGAIAQMSRTNEQLAGAMEMIGSTSRDTRAHLEETAKSQATVSAAAERLAVASEKADKSVVELSQAVGQIEPTLSQSRAALARIAESLTTHDQRLAEMWQQFAARIEARLPDRVPAAGVESPTDRGMARVEPMLARPRPVAARARGDVEPEEQAEVLPASPAPPAVVVEPPVDKHGEEIVRLLSSINARLTRPEPKGARRKLLIGAATLVAIAAAGSAAVWYFLYRG